MVAAVKWIDLPPVWLVAALVCAWWQADLLPMGRSFGGIWASVAGTAFVVAGGFLAGAAVWQFKRYRTTVIPHQTPDAMITTGVFAYSRNPIYVADVMILTGFILRWDAVVSLVLVPVFMAVITRRFILGEEARLRRKFGHAFDAYAQKTRRWL